MTGQDRGWGGGPTPMVSWAENFKPWVVAMVFAVLIAYAPPLYQIVTGNQFLRCLLYRITDRPKTIAVCGSPQGMIL